MRHNVENEIEDTALRDISRLKIVRGIRPFIILQTIYFKCSDMKRIVRKHVSQIRSKAFYILNVI